MKIYKNNFFKKVNPIIMKKNIIIIIIGLFAGIISGLFGAGGGMILVPALVSIIKLDEVKARATAITGILFMVITSSFFYFKADYINWNLGIKCGIGGIIGGFIGSKILVKISKKYLNLIFIFFLFYTSIKMII